MRIVVSGTHASGKSTLLADFARTHLGYTVLPDPFELVDEDEDAPGAAMITAQLRLSADRLRSDEFGEDVIAERAPIDFLAYLLAMAELSGRDLDEDLLARATDITAAALRRIDLLVVLPLTAADPIPVGADEHPELREAMDAALLDLLDDPDVVGDVAVAEITGDPGARLAALDALVAAS